jgi:hypothetical protein
MSGSMARSVARKPTVSKRSPAAKRKKSKTTAQNARISSRQETADKRDGILGTFRFPLFSTANETGASTGRKARTAKQHGKQASRLIGAAGAVRKAGRDYEKMPSWRELDTNRKTLEADRPASAFDSISTKSMALVIAVFVAVFTLYIGNVHSTQQELSRLQKLQSVNSDLRMKMNRVKGDYDHMVGPAQIHSRAKHIGMIESDPRPLPVIHSPK